MQARYLLRNKKKVSSMKPQFCLRTLFELTLLVALVMTGY